MSTEKRASTCEPDTNVVFERKEDSETKIDKRFILAMVKFKLMVITGAWKYVLTRVFKWLKNC